MADEQKTGSPAQEFQVSDYGVKSARRGLLCIAAAYAVGPAFSALIEGSEWVLSYESISAVLRFAVVGLVGYWAAPVCLKRVRVFLDEESLVVRTPFGDRTVRLNAVQKIVCWRNRNDCTVLVLLQGTTHTVRLWHIKEIDVLCNHITSRRQDLARIEKHWPVLDPFIVGALGWAALMCMVYASFAAATWIWNAGAALVGVAILCLGMMFMLCMHAKKESADEQKLIISVLLNLALALLLAACFLAVYFLFCRR